MRGLTEASTGVLLENFSVALRWGASLLRQRDLTDLASDMDAVADRLDGERLRHEKVDAIVVSISKRQR